MQGKTGWRTGICLIVGGILAVIGWSILTFYGKPLLERAKASRTWPTTNGVVTESRLKRHNSDEGSDTFSPEVVFRYQVNGRQIHSDQIWLATNFSSSNRAAHQRVLAEYPIGKEVTVFYNPDDPFIAVLKPGPIWMSYFGIIFGWIFFGLGISCFAGVGLATYLGRRGPASDLLSVHTSGSENTQRDDDELLI